MHEKRNESDMVTFNLYAKLIRKYIFYYLIRHYPRLQLIRSRVKITIYLSEKSKSELYSKFKELVNELGQLKVNVNILPRNKIVVCFSCSGRSIVAWQNVKRTSQIDCELRRLQKYIDNLWH